jgi:hypothetical protein
MISAVAAREMKPIWTTSSFLVYAGGLTVLVGAISALEYLASNYGSAAEAGWALLVLVILYTIAHALNRRDRATAAGIFAFVSVIAWGAFVYFVFTWWGWNGFKPISTTPLHHWSWSRLAFEVLILAAAWDDRRRFRFPFIRVISAVVFWAFVVDLITAGGNWTAAVTLIVGLLYLAIGNVVDKPSAFWLHLVGGVLIGGAILYWCHTSDGDFAVVSIIALVFVLIAYWTRRSSWAVLGTIGFFAATGHYVADSPTGLLGGGFGFGGFGGGETCVSTATGAPICRSISGPWAPALAYGLLGLFLVALGMLSRRRRRAIVVE